MEEIKFKKFTFKKGLSTMLRVDFLRLSRSALFYILLGVCFVIPILVTIMTTLMAGTTTTNPETNVTTTIEAFDSVWQVIGAKSDAPSSMDLTGMCNINLVYFVIAILVCLFVSDDFRSGYSKNLFTVRASKLNYVISKTLALSLAGILMLLCFFVGAMIGGAISSLPFTLDGVNGFQLFMCILSKLLLALVFVPIYLVVSVAVKQRTWLAVLLSLGAGMLLFSMIPMITPLDSTILNPVLCLGGGAMLSVGLGAISNLILKKTSLV